MDFCTRVDLLPLRDCNAQKEVGIGKHRAAGIQTDEYVENSLNILCFLFVIMDQGFGVDYAIEPINYLVSPPEFIADELLSNKRVQHCRPILHCEYIGDFEP